MKYECFKCEGCGFNDVDEAGLPYTCYRCCGTGYISEAEYIEQRQDAIDSAEYRRYLPPVVTIYDGEYGDCYTKQRKLLPLSVLPSVRQQPFVAYSYDCEDIPF